MENIFARYSSACICGEKSQRYWGLGTCGPDRQRRRRGAGLAGSRRCRPAPANRGSSSRCGHAAPAGSARCRCRKNSNARMAVVRVRVSAAPRGAEQAAHAAAAAAHAQRAAFGTLQQDKDDQRHGDDQFGDKQVGSAWLEFRRIWMAAVYSQASGQARSLKHPADCGKFRREPRNCRIFHCEIRGEIGMILLPAGGAIRRGARMLLALRPVGRPAASPASALAPWRATRRTPRRSGAGQPADLGRRPPMRDTLGGLSACRPGWSGSFIPAPMTACRRRCRRRSPPWRSVAKAAGRRSQTEIRELQQHGAGARPRARRITTPRTQQALSAEADAIWRARPRPARCCAIFIPRTSSRNSSPGSG